MTSILKNQPTDFDAEQYNKYIKYYLDNEFSGIVYNLPKPDLDRFFEMMTTYASIIDKVFLLPGDALSNYIIYGHQFYEALKNPHEGIDYTPSYIVKLYREWLAEKELPEPEDMVVKEGLNQEPMIEFQKNL